MKRECLCYNKKYINKSRSEDSLTKILDRNHPHKKEGLMSNINEIIERINALAAKKKAGQALTPEELNEKKALYNIYLRFIRGQVKDQLDSIEFVDAEPTKEAVIVEGSNNKPAEDPDAPKAH